MKNVRLARIEEISEEVPSLKDVRIGKNLNFYLAFRDESGNITNYMKVNKDGKSHFILNKRHYSGAFILGKIENGEYIYVCGTWQEAFMVRKMRQKTVVLPSSRTCQQGLEEKLRARGCILIKPTVEDQIRPAETLQDAFAWPSPALDMQSLTPSIAEPVNADSLFIGQSLLGHFSPVRWLVRDFIPRGQFLGFIYSPSGVGKTFFALDAALHMASALPAWHGIICHKAKVLYVAGESVAAIRSRIIAFAKTYTDAFMDNFCFYPLGVPLSSPEGMSRLHQALMTLERDKGFRPDIIFFDTWNTFFSGEENNAVDIAKFRAEVILRLQLSYDCAIVFLHHTTKANDTDLRGSGAIKGMADFTLLIRNLHAGEIRIEVTKNRLGMEGDYVDARIKPTTIDTLGKDEDGFHVCAACLEHVGNSKIPGIPSERATKTLSAICDAMARYGTELCTGLWTISGHDFENHMKEALGKDDAWLSGNLSISGRFFDELVDCGRICISRDETGKLASITMLDTHSNGRISSNSKLVRGQQDS